MLLCHLCEFCTVLQENRWYSTGASVCACLRAWREYVYYELELDLQGLFQSKASQYGQSTRPDRTYLRQTSQLSTCIHAAVRRWANIRSFAKRAMENSFTQASCFFIIIIIIFFEQRESQLVTTVHCFDKKSGACHTSSNHH